MRWDQVRGAAAGAVVALSAFLLVGAAAAPSSARWKSRTEIAGGPGASRSSQAEIWMREGKFRIERSARGGRMNTILIGKTVYQWRPGDKTGTKMSTEMQTRRPEGADYVQRTEEFRKKGKKIGTETVSGHVCDVYERAEAGQKKKETAWIARDLGFPIQYMVERGDTKTVTTATDIQAPASIPDSLFSPPREVRFEDLAEIMKRFGVTPRPH